MIIHECLMRIRHEEILAEAARARLAAPKSQQPKPKSRFYARVLNRLGNQLCNWGGLLQVRYGDKGLLNSSQSMDEGAQA